ncbi:MAG: protein-L-isoaspartate O-methyltransferase, partial [Alphaproteobacteria bacterium]|nr:protein-L-isoaspartate O-methyltransferase [Alphaproteobacteria bacterium]
MFSPADHAVLRRAYARYVTFLSGADNTALEQAFAAVPRESYLGAGPWAVLAWGGDYRETPDSDPA